MTNPHGSMWRAVLSSDGKHVLASGDAVVSLWDALSGKEIRQFKGHPKQV